MFAGLSTGLSNKERGEIILEVLVMELSHELYEGKRVDKKLLASLLYRYKKKNLLELVYRKEMLVEKQHSENSTCEICGGLMDKIDDMAIRISREMKDYRFETFAVGVERISDIEKKEDEFRVRYNIKYGENIRNEISREIGKRIMKLTKLNYSDTNPDIQIIVNIVNEKIKIRTKKIVITGNIVRIDDIPIFAKTCSNCKGVGCAQCNYTGKTPDNSIEYILGEFLLALSQGKKWKFGVEYKDDKLNFRISIISPKIKINETQVLYKINENKELSRMGISDLSIWI